MYSIREMALEVPKERYALWHQAILSIYGTHTNGWDANTMVKWSHCCPWKTIAQVFPNFSRYTWLVVGDGTRIRLWEDLWSGDQPLCSQFPGLFRIVTVKNLTISLALGSTNSFFWNLNFHRNLSDLERLMSSLSHLHYLHLLMTWEPGPYLLQVYS